MPNSCAMAEFKGKVERWWYYSQYGGRGRKSKSWSNHVQNETQCVGHFLFCMALWCTSCKGQTNTAKWEEIDSKSMVRSVWAPLLDHWQLSLNDLAKWLNGRCWNTWFINVAPAQKPGHNVVVAIIRTLAANWLGNCAERWWEMLTNELRHCLSNGLVAFLVMLSNMSISDLVVFVFNDSLVACRHFSHVSFIQWPRFSFHFYITEEIADMWFPPHFFLPLWQCLQQFLYKSQNSSTKVSN